MRQAARPTRESKSFGFQFSAPILREAADALAPFCPATPIKVLKSRTSDILVKLENNTPSGSFKYRGATLAISELATKTETLEIVTASSGNHGRAVAMVGRQFAKEIIVFVPENTTKDKQLNLKELGARVVPVGMNLSESLSVAENYAKERGALFLPATDPMVILGNCTAALELSNQIGSPDQIFVPIGVGSLATALCWCKPMLFPNCEIIGVVPESVPAWIKSFRANAPMDEEPGVTIADGLRIKSPNPLIAQELTRNLSGLITVTEDQIAEAKQSLLLNLEEVVEPSGCVAVAAALANAGSSASDLRICAFATGGTPQRGRGQKCS